jgi:hypothetical protein
VYEIQVSIWNIYKFAQLMAGTKKTARGAIWKVCVTNRYGDYGGAFANTRFLNAMVSCTAAAASSKKWQQPEPCRAEVTLGLEHVRGGSYKKELGATVCHTLTFPPDGTGRTLDFNIHDIKA